MSYIPALLCTIVTAAGAVAQEPYVFASAAVGLIGCVLLFAADQITAAIRDTQPTHRNEGTQP